MMFRAKQVFLACGCTDMRKSINGLSILVQSTFFLDPFTDAYFVFCNNSRHIIKLLEWDGNGFWLHTKRLERGHFKWPNGDSPTMTLSNEELACLLSAPGVEQKLRRKDVKYENIF